MVRKIISLLLIFFMILFSLTGCFDSQEFTKWAFIYSIGAEKGVKDRLRLTVQIPSRRLGDSAQQNDGQENVNISESAGIITITIDCPTFYSGIDMIGTFLSREINYMHAKYIVFSENLAKEGIEKYLTGFIRGRQVRRDMYIIVAKGSVRDFLLANLPVADSSLTRREENQMDETKKTVFILQYHTEIY